MKSKKEMYNILFGKDEEYSVVVVTPIQSAYNKLKNLLECNLERNNSFFLNAQFDAKNKRKGLLILSPEGIAAQDSIYTFKNVDIIFYGYAGSIDKSIEIGTKIEIHSIVDNERNNIIKELFCIKQDYKKAICGYSPCMLGPLANKYSNKAQEKGAQIVEMEMVYCGMIALLNKCRFTAWVVISDMPGIINFWELKEQDKNKFEKAKNEVINDIVNYVKD